MSAARRLPPAKIPPRRHHRPGVRDRALPAARTSLVCSQHTSTGGAPAPSDHGLKTRAKSALARPRSMDTRGMALERRSFESPGTKAPSVASRRSSHAQHSRQPAFSRMAPAKNQRRRHMESRRGKTCLAWPSSADAPPDSSLLSTPQLHSMGIRVSVAIQFTSQVLPPSSENACSKRQEFAVMSDQTLRTRIMRPLKFSKS